MVFALLLTLTCLADGQLAKLHGEAPQAAVLQAHGRDAHVRQKPYGGSDNDNRRSFLYWYDGLSRLQVGGWH